MHRNARYFLLFVKYAGYVSCVLILLATVLSVNNVVYGQSVQKATGGENISADDANQTFTTLTGPVITENYAGQLAAGGTIIFNAPNGFEWDTTGTVPAVTISNAPGGGIFNTLLTIQFISRTRKYIEFQVTRSSYVGSGFFSQLLNNPGMATFSNFRIRPTKGTLPNSGIISNSGTTAPGGVGTVSYGQITMIHGAKAKVLFQQQPENTTINKPIQPAVTAIVTDQYGNRVPASGITVSIAKSSGSGTLSGTLSQQTDSTGVVSFNDLSINQTGTIVLTVSSSGLTSDSSNTFQILPAGQLTGFLVQNTSGGNINSQTAGQPFSVKITAVDGNNSVIKSFNGTVNISSNGKISSGGGTSVNFVNGVLSSKSITITNTGSFSIEVTETNGTTTGKSNDFTVNPGPADAITSTITASPKVILNDGQSTSTITVQLKDAYGNNIKTGGDIVQLSTSASNLSSVSDNGNGTYTASLNSTTAPVTIANISGTLNGVSMKDGAQVIIAKFYTWTSQFNPIFGGQTEQWNNTNNWNGGVVPDSQEVAYIPSVPANNATTFPVIGQNTKVLAIVIADSASVTVNSGYTLDVKQSLSGKGSVFSDYSTLNIGGDITVSDLYGGTSTINLNGNKLQKLTGNIYGSVLNINNNVESSGYINIIDTLNIQNSSLNLDKGAILNDFGDLKGTGNDTLNANNSTIYVGGNYDIKNSYLATSSVTFNGKKKQTFKNANQFKNLTVNNTSNVLAGGNVTVNDSLYLTKGSLIIPSGSNLIANTKSINSGSLIFNRVIPDSGWALLSSPVTSTYGNFFKHKIVTQGYTGSTYPSKQPNVMTYDESYTGTDNQRYRAPSDTGQTIPAGKGLFVYVFGNVPSDPNYTIATPDTFKVKGEEHEGTGGKFNFNVTYTAKADTGWNLVGNPYGATIDWDNTTAWTKTNMSNSIYVWDQSANNGYGDYLVWNGITGSLGNGLIAPFQGFWVKADTTNPSLVVSKSAKTINGTFYKKSGQIPVLSLYLKGDDLKTSAYVMFSKTGKIGKDPLDAYRLVPLTRTYLGLFTAFHNGTRLAINDLPLESNTKITVPLGVTGYRGGKPISGTFTLSWLSLSNIPKSWSIKLLDKNTGKSINMRNTTQYQFHWTALKAKIASNRYKQHQLPMIAKSDPGNDRFSLQIEYGNPDQSSSQLPKEYKLYQNYPNPFNPTTTIKFALPKSGNVSIVIYNILGQRVAILTNQKYQAGYHEIMWDDRGVASGLYLYHMIAGGKSFTKKMIVLK